MGFSHEYSDVPDWVEKPEGYQAGAMVKYQSNVFIAHWASKPREGDPNENGWRLHDNCTSSRLVLPLHPPESLDLMIHAGDINIPPGRNIRFSDIFSG